ncbi:MAG: tetratricopeptide repeat protein [Myxococcales bacterium]
MGACLLVAALVTGQASSRPALARAVAYFNDFDDARAQAELRRLLQHPQPRAVAAKAHLYLGLIAMNRFDTDAALAEFKQALMIDPGIDLVIEASPKARLAFQEARHELEGQLASSEAGLRPAPHGGARASPPPAAAEAHADELVDPFATKPAPAAAVSAEAAPATRGRPHALAITLGVVGIAAAALGAYGGVEIMQYDSYVNGVNARPGRTAYGAGTPSASAASVWGLAWIPLVAVGAAGIVGGALAW